MILFEGFVGFYDNVIINVGGHKTRPYEIKYQDFV